MLLLACPGRRSEPCTHPLSTLPILILSVGAGTVYPRLTMPAGEEQVQTWHYGVVARWWAEFNTAGPEIAYFRQFIEGDGQPALDAACGTGRLLLPYIRDGFDVD